MSQPARSMFNRLKTRDQLPHIKSELIKLQEMLQNPDIDLALVAKELRKEPLIATKVIEIAENMARSKERKKVSEANRLTNALVFIGSKTLEDILLVAFLKTVDVQTAKFSSQNFWGDSQMVASVAEVLCEKLTPYNDACEAYLDGFLCNIGKIVSAFYFPEQVDRVYEDINNPRTKLNWLQAEKAHKFHDHRVLGEIAAAFWGMPQSTLMAIQLHHSQDIQDGKKKNNTEIIALANQLTHWILLRPERIDNELLEHLAKRFEINNAEMEKLVKEMVPISENFAS